MRHTFAFLKGILNVVLIPFRALFHGYVYLVYIVSRAFAFTILFVQVVVAYIAATFFIVVGFAIVWAIGAHIISLL